MTCPLGTVHRYLSPSPAGHEAGDPDRCACGEARPEPCRECGYPVLEHGPAESPACRHPRLHEHVWGPEKGEGRMHALAIARGWEPAVCVVCGEPR